jgi:hypothetical protein
MAADDGNIPRLAAPNGPSEEPRIQPVEFVTEAYSLDPAAADGGGVQVFTLDELKEEMKKLAWTKGDFKIVPYGVLWGSAIYATERVNPGQYILWVHSPTVEGENDCVIDTRRTRLGIDVTGPTTPLFGETQSGAKVEVDFHGNQPPFTAVPVAPLENKALLLLRHAYAEVKNDDWRLLAGQTFDLISPLYPGTLNYTVGWDTGNIGYRRMQLRLERYLHFSETLMVSLQGAACQNIVTDSNAVSDPESSAWPILMGRVGLTLGEQGPNCLPITCGASGHIGEQGFDFATVAPVPAHDDARIQTWSVNADLRVPVTDRLGFQGEFFSGDNLGTFLGGIGQGVNLVPAVRRSIRATGGWVEVWYDWTTRLHGHIGYGVDDPLNSDLTLPAHRTYNQFIFSNVSFDITKKMIVGFEVGSWKTHYAGQLPGDALTFEFSGQYGF